jgi:predicted alpha/beta hydrolase family esterase
MTRQILFVQGGGEGFHDHWDDKLIASLRRELGPGYEIRYPRMPEESDPHYARWKRRLQAELGRLDDGAVLVGHSLGATFLINALSEAEPQREIAGIFLVAAPFIGDGGWPSEEIEPNKDLAARLPEDVPIFFYHGRDDVTAPVEHLRLYARAIPRGVTRLLEARDHQLNDDLYEVAEDIRRLD